MSGLCVWVLLLYIPLNVDNDDTQDISPTDYSYTELASNSTLDRELTPMEKHKAGEVELSGAGGRRRGNQIKQDQEEEAKHIQAAAARAKTDWRNGELCWGFPGHQIGTRERERQSAQFLLEYFQWERNKGERERGLVRANRNM